MSRRTVLRLHDIKEAITNVRSLLADVTFDSLKGDIHKIAAFERYLEVISEASRHVPDDLKTRFAPDIQWRKMADLGNLMRHTYHYVDLGTLWDIYVGDLDPLEATIDEMISVLGEQFPPPR